VTTLMQLRRLVRSRLGVPTSDQMFQDDQLDDHINLAVEAVEAEQRWPWQEHVDTVYIEPNTPDIPLGPRWRATRMLLVADTKVELQLVSPSDVLSWYVSAVDVGGPPTVWAPIGDHIVVRPLPSEQIALTHYYYSHPNWLRGDDDEPETPSQFVGAIVAKAAELLSVREDDRAAAGAHNVEYNQWIERMRRDVRRSTSPVRIRVRAGSWL
jgi:hypothetical protein